MDFCPIKIVNRSELVIYRPILIPFFSGIHTPRLKTCLLFDQFEHAHILESVYRPYVMSCVGDARRFGSDLHHIEQMVIVNQSIEETIKQLREDFNIIIHTDDEVSLNMLMENSIFGYRSVNVALSTGITRQRDLKELAHLAQNRCHR